MIRLYFAPRTRAVRVAWLLEELDLRYQLVRVPFQPPQHRFFGQATPTGKLPVLEDGAVTLAESGAIVEYLLETHGQGRLAPPPGTPERAAFLQWLHYAEATAFPPLGIVVWLTRYRDDQDQHLALVDDARQRARASFEFLESRLTGDYLLPSGFSAADVMMGFTLVAAMELQVLDSSLRRCHGYAARLLDRPALQRVLQH